MGYRPCNRPLHTWMSFTSIFTPRHCLSSFNWSFSIDCARFIQNSRCLFTSSVINGPECLSVSVFLAQQLCRNRKIHAWILTALLSKKIWSDSSGESTATLKTAFVALASASLSGIAVVTISLGHLFELANHDGPSHHI